MSLHDRRSAARPEPDGPMLDVARYVAGYTVDSREAFDTARYMLLDSLACAALAMDHEACVRHLGPLVPGADMKGGARVPFTHHELDPVQAAYNIGVQVRWLDFNDTWLAAEWGHPSDNLGAILAVADQTNGAGWFNGYARVRDTGQFRRCSVGDADRNGTGDLLFSDLDSQYGYGISVATTHQTQSLALPLTLTIDSAPASAVVGSPFTVTVRSSGQTQFAPTGAVVLSLSGAVLAMRELSGGEATVELVSFLLHRGRRENPSLSP